MRSLSLPYFLLLLSGPLRREEASCLRFLRLSLPGRKLRPIPRRRISLRRRRIRWFPGLLWFLRSWSGYSRNGRSLRIPLWIVHWRRSGSWTSRSTFEGRRSRILGHHRFPRVLLRNQRLRSNSTRRGVWIVSRSGNEEWSQEVAVQDL